VSQDIVHMIDIFPTFLAAARERPEASWHVDGRNLLPVWEGQERVPERTLFWEWRTEGSHQLAAMRGDLKLVLTGRIAPELFDVVNDPAERRSIIAQHPELAKQLRKELDDWLKTETEEAKWGKAPKR
jgi:arylsulfatase A-like enzyme